MIRYAQIDVNGKVVSDSFLSGKLELENLIEIPMEFSLYGKQYINGKWVEEINEPAPTDAELMLMETQAELYEEQQSNNLTLMETMAEIYETILGGE